MTQLSNILDQYVITTTTSTTTIVAKKICKKCGHPQELRSDRSAKTSWACSDCGHRNKLKLLVLITFIALSALTMQQIAYAEIDPTDIPFPSPWMKDCTYSVGEFLIFNCLWRSDRIPEEVQADLEQLEENIDILPEDEYEASKTRIIIDWLTAPDPDPIPEPEPPRPTVRDILISKLPPGVKEAVDRLQECRYGYDGWEAIQQKSAYEVPDQFIRSIDDYTTDKIVGDLNKAYEACRAQRDYPLSSSYKTFIDADVLGLDRFGREPTHTFNQTTNFTRGSDIYAPLTKEDFAKAIKNATDWMKTAPYTDPTLGCIPRDAEDVRCRNQGNPEPIIKDLRSYNDYINFKAGQIQTPQDYADTIAAAKQAQCTVHYPIYKHRIASGSEGGMELPVWLEHCESIEDEFNRIGFACYTGGEQILCSDLRKIQDAREN